MRLIRPLTFSVFLALFGSASACNPVLNSHDDDDSAAADDDDSGTSDDDDSGTSDDDDSGTSGDDDDSGGSPGDDDDSVTSGDDDDVVNPGDDDDSGPQQPPVLFEAGWSFGECGGLCFGTLQLVPGATIDYSLGSWDNTSSWTLSAALTGAGEGDLAALVSAVNVSALDPVYGCPDCGDGGASSMTWHEISVSFTTSYEYASPPPPLVSLDEAVQAIMDEAVTCTFSYWLVDPGNCVPVF